MPGDPCCAVMQSKGENILSLTHWATTTGKSLCDSYKEGTKGTGSWRGSSTSRFTGDPRSDQCKTRVLRNINFIRSMRFRNGIIAG
jgi:hypothetical protein